jgi:urease accessory protein
MKRIFCLAAALAAPATAMAHTGVSPAGGALHGFLHPLTGLDHLLAMTLVGVLAWQLGGRALWRVPVAFLLLMALGGGLAVAGIGLPGVEPAIALSVLALGLLVACGARPTLTAAMGIVGLFALFHGHAHGSEMPDDAGGLAYAGGFLAATALLHGGGLMAGAGLAVAVGRRSAVLVRAGGAGVALAGGALLGGVL